MLLAPSLAEPLSDVAIEGARHAAPIDSAVFVKAGVFAREQRIDKKRRDFIQRHFQPVRAGQPAVDFAIDVENRVALRHRADAFQVERLRPDGVEREHGRERRRAAARRRQKASTQRQPAATLFVGRPLSCGEAVRAKSFIVKKLNR